MQDYYNFVDAQRKVANASQALGDANSFVNISQKQEQAGNVSHLDVVKAQLQFEQRSRDLDNARLAADQAQLALAILLFPNFDKNFSVVDDLSALPPLSSWEAVQSLALRQNPEMRSARASLQEAPYVTSVARYGYLPSLALTFYYGIDANQFAARTYYPTAGANRSNLPNNLVPYRQNLGYWGDITLDIPVWNWGITQQSPAGSVPPPTGRSAIEPCPTPITSEPALVISTGASS